MSLPKRSLPVGGVIHTYQKYSPTEFPSPTAEPPDLVSGAFEHALAYGNYRQLTEEELARAIQIDPSQIGGLGPSIDMLLAMLEERKRKILETKIAWGHITLLGKSLYQMCNAMNNEMEVTSPDAVGGGRMEPSATFGRGQQHCISLLGPQPRSPPSRSLLRSLRPPPACWERSERQIGRQTKMDGPRFRMAPG